MGPSRLKNKKLIVFLIGQEGTRIYQQNNPHTKNDTCITYEFAHELSITFTKQETQHMTDFKSKTHDKNHTNHSKHFTAD